MVAVLQHKHYVLLFGKSEGDVMVAVLQHKHYVLLFGKSEGDVMLAVFIAQTLRSVVW